MSTSVTTLSASPPLSKPPALDNTYGAGLIGTSVGLMLYGLTIHQVYRYFRLYPTDAAYLKIYIVILLLLETFHIIISLHTCYFYLITNYLQPAAFAIPVWSVDTVPLVTGVIAVVSQCFFAHRVWLIGPRFRIVVAITVVLLLAELGLTIAATIETYLRPVYASYSHVVWIFSSSFGVAIVVDSLLTGALVIVLHRSRTGIKRYIAFQPNVKQDTNSNAYSTDSMIDLLIVYSVNTGLVTGIFNILTFTFALVYPSNAIYGGFAIVTAKLYANSVLAALNTRKSLTKGSESLELDELGLSFAVPTTEHMTTVDLRHTNVNSDAVSIKPEALHICPADTDDVNLECTDQSARRMLQTV
ncbi:hypothetical protein GY45DRAFT_1374278 [Cubamyces sp. BRFM 1775]|nr:hypothetical protein GY45DRAFT_1374278 [Cubamyces sp. BRFM 1775]